MAKHYWGVFDCVLNELVKTAFYSRSEARKYCKPIYGYKVVKLIIEPEKKRQKKEEVEYFTCNNFYYKIENNQVLSYSQFSRMWGPISSEPEWVRKHMTKVSANEIKAKTNS